MKSVAVVLLILLTASFEASLGALPAAFPKPNLSVILAAYFAMRLPHTRGGVASFALGYLRDLLSGGVLGANAVLLLAYYAAARAMTRRFFTRRSVLVLFMVAGGALLTGAAYYAVVRILEAPAALPPDFGRRLLAEAAATAAVALPVWALLEAGRRVLERRPAEGSAAP